MLARLKQRLPAPRGAVLDRLLIYSIALLVIAVGAFALYYYFDRQDSGGGADLTGRRIASAETAVREHPEDVSARVNLADLYFAETRFTESVEQYQVALQLDEENKEVLVGLGRALLASGDHKAAAEKFQKAIDLASEAALMSSVIETAYYYLGTISLTEKHPEEAVEHLKQALAIEPTDADALYLLGTAYTDAGDTDAAIASFAQAVRLVPNFTEAYEKLIVAYEGKGLEAEAQYARGMLAYSQDRYEAAVEDLEAAAGRARGGHRRLPARY